MKAVFICFFLSSLSFAADPSIVKVREDKIEGCLIKKAIGVPCVEIGSSGSRPCNEKEAAAFRLYVSTECESKIEDVVIPLRHWEGIDSLIRTSTEEIHIITTHREWESLWRRHTKEVVPSIDFENQTVVAVFQESIDFACPFYGIAVESANSFTFYFASIIIRHKIDWTPKPKVYGRYGIYVFPRITKTVLLYELNEGTTSGKGFHRVEYSNTPNRAK